MPAGTSRMVLLVDENVPDSIAKFLADRGHEVILVREVLPAGTPDPVVAVVGDRLSAIVVSWDRDFDSLVRRVPRGSRNKFRNLGRISFKCKETAGRALLEEWIDLIEAHYARCSGRPDVRMIAEIQGAALKLL